MGKTRDLFKKIRDTKGTFHAKMGSIKDRNNMDLAEVIKKRRQEYTELYKKDLNDPDNHDGMITHLESGNPEYSLEGLMLQLKIQYFCHLMPRTGSLEKTLMLGKIDGRRKD